MKVFVVSGATVDIDFVVDSVWLDEDKANERAASLNARPFAENPFDFEYDVEDFNLNGALDGCYS